MKKETIGGRGIAPMATAAAEKPVIVIGVDDSECAFAALEWTLDHFFSQTLHPPLFKLVVVHAKPIPEVFVGVAGPGSKISNSPITIFAAIFHKQSIVFEENTVISGDRICAWNVPIIGRESEEESSRNYRSRGRNLRR